MIRVLSLYDSSFRLSSSAMASSNACKHIGKMLNNLQCLRTRGAQEISKRTSMYLFGQFASLFRIVLDLIVEDREIEGQAQADGVCGVQVFLAYLESKVISLL